MKGKDKLLTKNNNFIGECKTRDQSPYKYSLCQFYYAVPGRNLKEHFNVNKNLCTKTGKTQF